MSDIYFYYFCMREIHRIIASAILLSNDGKLLLGKKDPQSGGVYLDCRHLPWGGVDAGESLHDAVIREVAEEVGIDIHDITIVHLPYVDMGVSEKTLKDTGEKVLCHMEFNRFQITIDKPAHEIETVLSDDLVEVRWFTQEELTTIQLVPGGREFFEKIGLL